MNRNQESIEQLKRLTQAAKNFYGNNYSPGFISHRNDTKHYLGEEYIPYDWGDDIDNPANDEYKNVYMNKNPNYDFSQKPQSVIHPQKPMQQTTQFKTPKPQTQTMQPKTQSSSLMPKQKAKGFGGYTTGNGSATIRFPSSFAQASVNKSSYNKRLTNNFYKHASQQDTEDNINHPYCDSKGLITGGVGLRIPDAKNMQKFTLTSQEAPVSLNNPAWNSEQINTFYNKMDNFCQNYKIGIDKNGNDIWNVASADQQRKAYQNIYQEELPYFQNSELEKASKNYVEQNVLPVIRKKLNLIGVNFDNDFNENGQLALMDVLYNVGENKFKLIDIEDANSVLNSDLSQDIKEKLIYNPNIYYENMEVQQNVLKNGYWPQLSKALINRDAVEAAKQSHRKDIQKERNKWTYDNLLNGFKK